MVMGYRGTTCYMAPEELQLRYQAILTAQLFGGLPDDSFKLDGRACDLFALGLVAYQFLTMRSPFPKLMTMEEYGNWVMLGDHAQFQALAQSYYHWQVGSSCSLSGSSFTCCFRFQSLPKL